MTVRLLQGDYPPFEKIIPTTHTTRIEVGKEAFLQGVQQMAVFARQNANTVTMEVEKSLKLATQASYIGSGSTEAEAKVEGEPMKVAFNYRYLRDYLAAVEDGLVTIILNGPLAPVKLLSAGATHFLHIIMPVKV